MSNRLELKAAARRERIAGKVSKAGVRMERDPGKPLDEVPVLKIGPLRVRSVNRALLSPRGIPGRAKPPRGDRRIR